MNEYTSKNVLKIKATKDSWRSLPVALYHGQTYCIYDNGKKATFRNQNHQLRVRLHKGMNYIQIQAPTMWYRYLAILISLGGICIFCLADTKKNRIPIR